MANFSEINEFYLVLIAYGIMNNKGLLFIKSSRQYRCNEQKASSHLVYTLLENTFFYFFSCPEYLHLKLFGSLNLTFMVKLL